MKLKYMFLCLIMLSFISFGFSADLNYFTDNFDRAQCTGDCWGTPTSNGTAYTYTNSGNADWQITTEGFGFIDDNSNTGDPIAYTTFDKTLNTDNWKIEFDYKYLANINCIQTIRNSAHSKYLLLVLNGGNYRVFNGTANLYGGSLDVGNWNHFKFEFIYDTEELLVYEDDVLIVETTYDNLADWEVFGLGANGGGTACDSYFDNVSITSLNVIPPLHIENITGVTNGFNYTYDVSQLNINLDTNHNATCYLKNIDTNVTTLFSDTNYLDHNATFTMGDPINETLTFNIQFLCDDNDFENGTAQSSIFTFYRQPEPLDFNIIIPQDQQVFNYNTQTIEFHMITNYVAECKYLTNNDSYIFFTQTNNSVHKTNFSVNENITTYYTTFDCYAPYILDSDNISVVFYIDENNQIITQTALSEITGQLPQIGGDVGGFTENVAPGIFSFLLYFGSIFLILAIFGALITLIAYGLKNVYK